MGLEKNAFDPPRDTMDEPVRYSDSSLEHL
jgi:hypothetical protein